MDSESKISSAEQRAARRDLWETARAAYDRPRQSQSEAMRDARRSVWEQAKAAGIQNDETPPPVPTGKETGLNDDPRIARLEGIVRDLAGRLDDLEDDYPESEIGGVGGGGGGSIWSGIVWFGGEIKWDFNRVDNDPQGELSEFGMYGMNGGNYEGSVRGEILKINRNSGSYRWGNFSDEGIFDDINVYEYFPVADQSGRDGIGAQIYVPLAGRTCGDVHLYTNPMRASLFIESATYEEDGESYNVTVSIKGGTWVHRMLASADIKDRDLEISMPVDGDFFCYVYIEGLYEDNLFQAQFGYSSEYPVNASDSLRRCLGKVTLVGAGDPDSYILLERRWAGGDIYTW